MSLRYRLFLWVSGLFVVISVCAYFAENHFTQRELKRAEAGLRQEILQNSEKRRVDLQNFLTSGIVENLVQIDAILNNISNFSPQALRFGPTSSNEKKGTWGDAIDLLLEDKWLDFIQNTNQGKTTSAVIPEQGVMGTSYRIPIDEDLAWAYVGDSEMNPVPYLAVRIPYSRTLESPIQVDDELFAHIPGEIPMAYLLFDVKQMQESALSDQVPIEASAMQTFPPISVNWAEGYELDVEPFVKAFRRARDLLRAKKIEPPVLSAEELKSRIDGAATVQNAVLNAIPKDLLASPISSDQLVNQKVGAAALRYTQINMIWALIAMFDSGIFGSDLFAFPSPNAVTVYLSKKEVGFGVHKSCVLFPDKIFDDSAYYQNNPPKSTDSHLAASLAVIPSPDSGHIFFGNTTQLAIETSNQEQFGYLTIGINADTLLQKLALAIHRTSLLVYQGKFYTGFGEGGEKLTGDRSPALTFSEMLKENSGSVHWNQEDYFFVRVQPFPHLDLQIFLLNPEAQEFALLNDLDAGSKRVVDAIRLNTHVSGFVALLIAILLLHNISRRITKPIIQLAGATKDVAEGHLDKVQLSLPVLKHNDEISVLCHSFDEMVKGLQDREKVKGVLNKVVSREIAQEILKGSVHLGGEEKKVTVLFADIREFTHLTQMMPPQQVIDLLNTCMTKISQVIDKNKGVIDKYVGDEAMALFGAPIAGSEDALNAIKSGMEMIAAMKQWNVERIARGETAIELCIGIHTGRMLAGNMGAENRLNYTVIGSGVNLASRVCDFAKKMEILITKDTLDEPFVKDRIAVEELPPMHFKGFDREVEVYRVLR